MLKYWRIIGLAIVLLIINQTLKAQPDTIVIGFGGNTPDAIQSSSDSHNPDVVMNQTGFLPNDNAASRFLSQATLGYNLDDINLVKSQGYEDWIQNQIAIPMPNTLKEQIDSYYAFVVAETDTIDKSNSWLFWEYAWWNYHMRNQDYLRQRVAFALSQILVISERSSFENNPFALSDYYDILMRNAFGNYRDILQEVTYHASMGVYLTYMKNPKSDPANNIFPDENYARELMQLFTIGLFELNPDGTRKLDGQGELIPTYDNDDIAEFSKIFTGLAWGDSDRFTRYGPMSSASYALDMQMFNDYHEPGIKQLLNGEMTTTADPAVDGNQDITEALDNLFNHPNTGPFVCHKLIQRLVTSNPSPAYIERVANVFADNGQGVRGDMAAVVTAILLDPVAVSCDSGDDNTFGMLREPFIRYFHVARAFREHNASTKNHRNVMWRLYDRIAQQPLASPSVFNFYQPDFQPIGPVEEADLFAPEFQILDAQTLSGYLTGLYEWVMEGYLVSAWDLYDGEDDASYADEMTMVQFEDEEMFTDDDQLHILLDRLNMKLAHGRLTQPNLDIMKETILQFPNESVEEKQRRARLAVYLVMASPEYLINR